MNIKRFFASLTAVVTLLCSAACSGKSGASGSSDALSVSEAASAGSAEVSAASSPETSEPVKLERSDEMNITTAAELVKKMKIGWNLGNTLDSTGGEGLDAETSWGNLPTTKEMIDEVAAKGFNVLRVPVSWGNHLNDDLTIDKAWLDRVQEVVNYGYDNGMYVILNTHHEEWYMPQKDRAEKDTEQLGKLWAQIAERFKDYGERLLFEGLNEPRLRDTGVEWTGNAEARDVINGYEQKFVDTVRASGGNNAKRALIISPYAASSMGENLRAVKVPENAGNVIVSVHAYLPYNFALNTAGTAFYDNDGSIDTLMQNIKSVFLDNGIPVIITEFGCMNKGNSEARLENINDYLTAANAIGVPCVWWDNGYSVGNGEAFGLLNRETLTWFAPEIVNKLIKLTENRG